MRRNLGNLKRMGAIVMAATMFMTTAACGKKAAAKNDSESKSNKSNSTTQETTTAATVADTVEVEVDGVKQIAEVGAIIETTNASGETVHYEVASDGTLTEVTLPVEQKEAGGVIDVVIDSPIEAPQPQEEYKPIEVEPPVQDTPEPQAPIEDTPAPPVVDPPAPPAPPVVEDTPEPPVTLTADMVPNLTGWVFHDTYDLASSSGSYDVATRYITYKYTAGGVTMYVDGVIIVGGEKDGLKQGYHYENGKMIFYNQNPRTPLQSTPSMWVRGV